jgi:hypothetical protein
MVEVTVRTFQGRFLLRPGRRMRELCLGVLGKAMQRYKVRVHAYAFLSNHYHLLLTPESAGQLALFMCYLNTNLSKEAGRLHHWRGSLFERRYQAIPVSDEETAQIARLKYVLSQGVKEGLVSRPVDWPGAHAVKALISGRHDQGVWFDRTRECNAHQRGEYSPTSEFATRLDVILEPLPCWVHLSVEEQRSRLVDLVDQIVREARENHRRTESRPLGRRRILKQDPHHRPQLLKWSPAPMVHTATRHARQEFRRAYVAFVAAFRLAAQRLLTGELVVAFPEGSFPPPLPGGLLVPT